MLSYSFGCLSYDNSPVALGLWGGLWVDQNGHRETCDVRSHHLQEC